MVAVTAMLGWSNRSIRVDAQMVCFVVRSYVVFLQLFANFANW